MPCCGETMQEALEQLAPDMGKSTARLRWRAIDGSIADRIDIVLMSWLFTPYMSGQRVRKIGVDCVQFIPAIYDTLFSNAKPTPAPRLGPDSGIHNNRIGFCVVSALKAPFDMFTVRDQTIEPGDVLVTRGFLDPYGPERMGHAVIAGKRPFSIFHADMTLGVCETSIHSMPGILRIYRTRRKSEWTS